MENQNPQAQPLQINPEGVFNFLAQMLEKANASGAYSLKESTAIFQALAQLQVVLFGEQEEVYQTPGPQVSMEVVEDENPTEGISQTRE